MMEPLRRALCSRLVLVSRVASSSTTVAATTRHSMASLAARPNRQQLLETRSLTVLSRHPLASASEEEATFEREADAALDRLAEYFDELAELVDNIDPDYDVQHSQGVLTIRVSPEHGTYVLNKQTPNRQIWLSSPKSGPKRYDLMNGKWVYNRDGVSLDALLTAEFRQIFPKTKVEFSDRL